MLNIRAKDCQYTVYPERRLVMCTIPNTTYTFIDDVTNEGMRVFINFNKKWEKRLKMPDQFVGVSMCHPDDKFDVEIGKQIAYNHARDRFNRSYYTRAQAFINLLDNYTNKCEEQYNDVGRKLSVAAQYRHKRIKELIAKNTQ